MDKNKKIITILSVFTIIFTLVGGTFAWWTWTSNITTGVAFTIEKEFSCSADGGQNINSTNIELQPTSDCTNSNYALQREIKITPTINRDNLTINLDMWLTVNNLSTNLSNSENLMYAITTNSNSCTDGLVSKGNFKGLTTNNKVNLLSGKEYTGRNLPQDTYYLYIWLDAAETNNDTQNQSFDFSLGGECSDIPIPESPALDPAMIPVTIANDGTVTTVSANDPKWYDYENKEWANIVLVENAEKRNHYLSNLSNNIEVLEEDIVEYYVWIPRYKYRLPKAKCSDLTNPTLEKNPECYSCDLNTINRTALVEKIKYYLQDNYAYCGAWDSEEPECSEEELREFNEIADTIITTGIYNGTIESWQEEVSFTPKTFLNESDCNFIFEGSNSVIKNSPISIDIAFEKKQDEMVLGDAISTYRSHPAFWTDDDNDSIVDKNELLSGIWFGKFEDTYITGENESFEYCYEDPQVDCEDVYDEYGEWIGLEGCRTETICEMRDQETKLIKILPNIVMNPSLEVGNLTNSFSTYHLATGLTLTNRHNIKNSEWGAVAYLSHSKNGINGQVRTNNFKSYSEYNEEEGNGGYTYMTGCGAAEGVTSNVSTCAIPYGSGVSSYPQSSTGNISGIFDMEGGRCDKATSDYIIIDYDNVDNTGKCDTGICYGHAINETDGWYNQSFYADPDMGAISYRYGLFNGGRDAIPGCDGERETIIIK